jgi:HlyD family secretion protein
MQPPTQIFRKSALERLSTPEQLDRLIEVTTPRGWWSLYAVCGLLFAILVWSFVGRLPTTISGKVILLPPRGVDEIYATGTGFVTEVLVKENDHVEPGEVVAYVQDKTLAEKTRGSRRDAELKIASLQQKIPYLERQAKAKKEAADMGLIASDQAAESVGQLSQARMDLESLRNQLSLSNVEYKGQTEIRAVTAGRIVELLTSPGALVQMGSPVMTVAEEKDDLTAIMFIPKVGDRAKVGMEAQISPAAFPKEEYGFLKGEITFVSMVPARTHMLYELTRNRILNEELSKGGAPFILRAKLIKDPKTPSGYAWSSSHGPKHRGINAGMIGEARVVVENRRPIAMAIPALKNLLGL